MLITSNKPFPNHSQYFEFGEIGVGGFGYLTLKFKNISDEKSANGKEIEKVYHFPYKILKGPKGRTKIRAIGALFQIFTQTGNLTATDINILNNHQEWFIKSFERASLIWQEQKMVLENRFSKCLFKGKLYDLEFKIGSKSSYQIIHPQLSYEETNGNDIPGKIIITCARMQAVKKTKTALISAMLRKEAQICFEEKTMLFAIKMGLEYAKVTIKTQHSKWGSCSINKNINYNWRAIMLEPELIDYLIVHELAHLKHLDHSQKFWDFVEVNMPGGKNIDNLLKQKSWITSLYVE